MKLLLAFIFSLFAAVTATPNPLPGTENVVARGPSIIYNGDSKKYFLFHTAKGINISTSPSLTGPWSHAGIVLTNGSKIPIPPEHTGTEAADVNFINGRYVLYYAPSMESGTWQDHGAVIHSSSATKYNAIDPNTIVTPTGFKLTFGSWSQGIFQVPMTNITAPATPPPGAHLAGGNQTPSEAGFTYKPKKADFFYLFYSNGISPLPGAATRPPPGKEYKVLVERSKNVDGPYVDQTGLSLTDPPAGTLVLGSHDNVYAPGGQSVYLDPVSGRDVIAYYYIRKDEIGGLPFLGINFLDFSSGWPELVAK
ncbi:glycoside hydrolase family 43 protein [Epithele typhae]|uniref:glycoside hydrolase family 43 protein n=1 Tax=Epithele typhae TaxID=378194 RepID=UPI00200724F4|nr:glycoside hydrolase family 43 protein [Epithele typhae]KAH9918393.1 glycoside hydrolase family 43 protein [Epithele typhae]